MKELKHFWSPENDVDLETLGILDHKGKIINPFERRTREELENPALHLLRMMQNPEYFYFTCKYLLNIRILPFQCVILREMWYKPFPMLIGSRGLGKSFVLALYALLRALFLQGRKIVITGAGFRQSKIIMQYAENIWHNSPVLRSLVAEDPRSGPHHDADKWEFRLGASTITALPIGDGSKIRGYRANDILADEFACLDKSTLIDTVDGLKRIGDTIGDPNLTVWTAAENVIERVAKYIRTPPTAAYRVRTKGNYEFVCSGIHKVGTANGWKLAKDLTKSDKLRLPRPTPFTTKYVAGVDENMGWLLGILVAEGAVNAESQISVKMTDFDCIGRVRESLMMAESSLTPGIAYHSAYIDDRGWDCKEAWTCHTSTYKFRERLVSLGLERVTAHDKKIPWSILQSSQSVVVSFLSALFEGDGSAFLWTDKKVDNKLGVAYYSVSEQLCREVQVVLRKLGFFCTRQRRRSKISKKWQWMLRLNGDHALALADLLKIDKWEPIVSAARRTNTRGQFTGVVWDKSRGKWKAEANIRGKKTYLGRFETRSEALLAVAEAVEDVDDYLSVSSVELIDNERVLYDYYLPESNSFIGNGISQHNSIPNELFETVISGFGVVNLDPVDKVWGAKRKQVMRRRGMLTKEMEDEFAERVIGNQTIISGTGFWQFNHFATYWKKWKGIIESKGDPDAIARAHGGEPQPDLDHRDYAIIRIPVELLPDEFMDLKHVARSRATVHRGIFMNEFGACFSSDSNGFYKRMLIETCVTTKPVQPVGSSFSYTFNAMVRGSRKLRYVYGVDTASESDRFAIVILEIHEDHRRIVYCWTATRKEHVARLEAGIPGTDHDFYSFCAKKIRELMRVFPCEHIAMDSQGGGRGVSEALHDPDKIAEDEQPIWEITEFHPLAQGKAKDSDDYQGIHILEMVNFADAKWTSMANHGMKKDFEDRVLLFPAFDPIVLEEAAMSDAMNNRSFDTLEDCVMEIEQLKEELATIVYSQTGTSGRDKWDTPEVKQEGSKKGRLRKDRYSALVMANGAARQLCRQVEVPVFVPHGGFVGQIKPDTSGQMYASGPSWFLEKANQSVELFRRAIRPMG